MIRSLSMLAAAVAALGLAGCLRPLYGSAEFGGAQAQQALAGVAVDVKGERLAHYLRNELEFNLRGGAPTTAAPRYTLTVNASSRTASAIIDRLSGVAESATLQIDASFTLREGTAGAVLTQGTATAPVSYDRSIQRFANIRAVRDAEIQGARQLADQIRSRVAAFLAAR